MVIERIKLKNFKNFDNLDLKLGQMNVIVGANASGKTNFIIVLPVNGFGSFWYRVAPSKVVDAFSSIKVALEMFYFLISTS